MAREAIFTEGFPVVCTPEQLRFLDAEAEKRKVSRAAVVRDAIDARYNAACVEPRDGNWGQEGQV